MCSNYNACDGWEAWGIPQYLFPQNEVPTVSDFRMVCHLFHGRNYGACWGKVAIKFLSEILVLVTVTQKFVAQTYSDLVTKTEP